MTSTTLLLIDVQNDFHPGGSLAIPTADEDAQRIANLINKNCLKISRIIETMDTHQELHIAHPRFWVDGEGNHPNVFTLISSDDIISGKWKPVMNKDEQFWDMYESTVDTSMLNDGKQVRGFWGKLDLKKYCIEYTKKLEARGRFKLCIWPEHCIIGTPGHNVVPNVRQAMDTWAKKTGSCVEWINKGEHLLTEMYSALQAEVPVSKSTSFNSAFFRRLQKTDRLLIAGQALSHCVNYTARDVVDHWPKDELHNIYILTDCCSSVPGFEEAGEEFLKSMKEAGVNVCTSKDVF